MYNSRIIYIYGLLFVLLDQISLKILVDAKGEDLKSIGNQFRNDGSGVLITPGHGGSGRKNRLAREYLQSVVKNLQSGDRSSEGLLIRVNIYSSLTENAFAYQHQNNGIRTSLMGHSEDGRPIYEIGVHQGLIYSSKYEDEIAYVLGHELGHISLGHLSGYDDASSINGRQRDELEADRFAIKLMKEKYNLDAVLNQRNLLEREWKISSLEAAAIDHHHPSLRKSVLLSEVQHIRRSNKNAAFTSFKAIPQEVKNIRGSPRDNRVSQNVDINKKLFLQWFKESIKNRSESLVLDSGLFGSSPPYNTLRNAYFNESELRDVFKSSLKIIENTSDFNNEQKLVSIFEVMSILDNAFYAETEKGARSSLEYLKGSDHKDLRRLLKKISFSKNNSWEIQSLLNRFSQRNSIPVGVKTYLNYLLAHPSVADVFDFFSKHSSKWKNLSRELRQFDLNQPISDFQKYVESYATRKNLEPEILEEVVRTIDQFDLINVAKGEDGRMKLIGLLENSNPNLGCNNQYLCEKLARKLDDALVVADSRKLKKIDSILTLDPKNVGESDLSKTLNKFNEIFAMSYYLRPVEFDVVSPHIKKIIQWRKKVSEIELGSDTKNKFESLTNYLARYFQQALNHGIINGNEGFDLYREIRDLEGLYLISKDSYPYLSRLDSKNLRELLLEDLPQTSHHVYDFFDKIVENPKERLQNTEINLGLIDYLKNNFTESQLNQRVKKLSRQRYFIEEEKRFFRQKFQNFQNLLAHRDLALNLLDEFSDENLLDLYKMMSEIRNRSEILDLLVNPSKIHKTNYYNPERLMSPSVHSLLEDLERRQKIGLTFEMWQTFYREIAGMTSLDINSLDLKTKTMVSEYFTKQLQRQSLATQEKILTDKKLFELLSPEKASDYIVSFFLDKVRGQENLEDKVSTLGQVKKKFNINSDTPELNRMLDNKVVESLKLQPGQLKFFFPEQEFRLDNYSTHIRGMSGILNEVQKQSVEEQIEFIEYILNHKDKPPIFIDDLINRISKFFHNSLYTVSPTGLIVQLRAKLARQTDLVKALTILPFFTGKDALLGTERSTQILLENILVGVGAPRKNLATDLAKNLIKGEGERAPMLLAMIFSQKKPGKTLSEGEILRALFSAYGVPGVKFAQYLAFTSDFKHIGEHLASMQNNAMSISYFDAMKILEKRFPNGLSDEVRVTKIKGSGSVNIAIEYYNSQTKKLEILTVSRDEVEGATAEDFRRLKEVIGEQLKTDEGRNLFGFAEHLDEIIKSSVELEFDREQVFENQKELAKIFNQKVNGWEIKMVEPLTISNGVIRMQKAEGVSAVDLRYSDPELYNSAMRATSIRVTDHLFRRDGSEKRGLNYYADSDFHDGQVFIDKKNRRVWLIDPGQSVKIKESEFKLGKNILSLLLNPTSKKVEKLSKSSLNPKKISNIFSASEIRSITKNKDTGDAFVKFVGLLHKRGGVIPLPTLQWVLGINRQIVLNKQVKLKLIKELAFDSTKRVAREVLEKCLGRMQFNLFGK